MAGPDKIIENNLDDIQGIDLNLENLFNRFILPIDRVRSFSVPTMVDRQVVKDGEFVTNDAANASDTDISGPQESRAHAFYRMIGFPIINQNLEFYNPGYDPTLKADQRRKNYDISAKISNTVKLSHILRENDVRSRMQIFSRQSTDATIYAIAIGVPNGTKPFLQMNTEEGFDFINTKDEQKFNIGFRKLYITRRYSARDGTELDNFFESGTHILRPFTQDPNIVDAVTGYSNETRHVCAPFLKTKKDTGIERNIFAKRPGIELILRLRLRAHDSRALNEELLPILTENQDDLSTVELTQIVSALLNRDSINNSDILDKLKNASNLELTNLNKLVKTIKGVIQILLESIHEIKDVSKKIKFVPLPSIQGPEGGCDNSNLLLTKQKTELEKRYLNLNIMAAQNKKMDQISDDSSILSQDFHLAQYEISEKPLQPQIEDVKEQINNYQRIGSDALSAIEIITGEISGLGLIDILAIYTALWSIDINVLISMLDENAFDRLYSFVEYRTQEVEARRSGGAAFSIMQAIQAFERQVINILSYSDRIFQQKLGAPLDYDGGSVPIVDLGV